MAISRLEMQGQIVRTQDFTQMKQQEDSKVNVQQSSMVMQKQKQSEIKAKRVNAGEKAENHHMNHHDAKEQGKNQYTGDGGKNRPVDGKVIIKGVTRQ